MAGRTVLAIALVSAVVSTCAVAAPEKPCLSPTPSSSVTQRLAQLNATVSTFIRSVESTRSKVRDQLRNFTGLEHLIREKSNEFMPAEINRTLAASHQIHSRFGFGSGSGLDSNHNQSSRPARLGQRQRLGLRPGQGLAHHSFDVDLYLEHVYALYLELFAATELFSFWGDALVSIQDDFKFLLRDLACMMHSKQLRCPTFEKALKLNAKMADLLRDRDSSEDSEDSGKIAGTIWAIVEATIRVSEKVAEVALAAQAAQAAE